MRRKMVEQSLDFALSLCFLGAWGRPPVSLCRSTLITLLLSHQPQAGTCGVPACRGIWLVSGASGQQPVQCFTLPLQSQTSAPGSFFQSRMS